MKIAIDKIRIAARIRKEVSKVDELAASIRDRGLISPIAVMLLDGGEYQLLAGLRRLRAMQINGETEIDAKVFSAINAEEALEVEFAENVQREEFTYSERMDFAELIGEIEQAKARDRMLAGKGSGAPVDVRPQGGKGTSRDAIGEKIGMSGRQYIRARYVAANAPPEIIDQLDRGETTVYQAYNEVRFKEKSAAPTSAPALPMRTEPPAVSNQQPVLRPKAEPPAVPAPKPPTRSPAAKTDPLLEKLRAEEAEAVRKRQEFDALSLDGKITDLQRQLKEERARAAGAESDLAREKERHQNTETHLNADIALLKNQLSEANARIQELEERYEPT